MTPTLFQLNMTVVVDIRGWRRAKPLAPIVITENHDPVC